MKRVQDFFVTNDKLKFIAADKLLIIYNLLIFFTPQPIRTSLSSSSPQDIVVTSSLSVMETKFCIFCDTHSFLFILTPVNKIHNFAHLNFINFLCDVINILVVVSNDL